MILNINEVKDHALLQRMYEEYMFNLPEYTKALKYYVGDTDIMENYINYEGSERSNRKVQDNFIKTFIDEEVAFMVGLPITYTSKEGNTKEIDLLDNIIENFDSCSDIDLATDFLTYGTAYEYYYLVGDELKTKNFSPLNSIAYVDDSGKVQLFIYFYTKPFDERKEIYMNVIDDKYIYHFDKGFNEIEAKTEHYFKAVPVSYCRMKNGFKDTIYYTSKILQDVYELALSDWSNEISDNRLAYLLITGMELDEEIAENIKKKGIIQCSDPNGKAEFITKNIDSDFIKSYRDIIKEDLYRVNHHVDNQTQIQSNTSGDMLQVRLNCLRIKITKQNKALLNAIKSRVKFIGVYYNLINTEDKKNDFSDIRVKTQLNIPSNDSQTALIMSQLKGMMSIRSGLERLSFVTDGEREFKRMLEENRMINQNDFDSTNDIPSVDHGEVLRNE